jgi:hypothetical protein
MLHMAAEDGEDSPAAPTRRRKRKTKVNAAAAPVADTTEEEEMEEVAPPPPPPQEELKSRDSSPVQLQVKDIVEATGGSRSSTEPSAAESILAAGRAMIGGKGAKKSSSSSSSSSLSNPSASMGDSLEQLLKDARAMKDEEDDEDEEEEGATGIKATIGKGLSTIVTADFFLVCIFLVWFLAGIFCSSILKDDTVQIAFNNNFAGIIQPALGVLMVGSIAGSFFQEDEEQEY